MYQQNIYSSYGLASNYPIRPDVKFRRLPFYDILADLLKPSTLVPQSDYRKQVGFFHFHLTPQQATDLVNSRLDREYGKQVQMRFCQMETSCEQEDYFPPNLIVEVNNEKCPLPNPISTNKSSPVNITQMVKLSPTVANSITVFWDADFGIGYAITVALVNRLSWQDLLQRLRSKGIKNADYTRALIKEKLNDNCEIITTSLMVSLKCPLGKTRMTTPCRAITCSHLQCFDASLFLQMNERKPTWICPVCDKPSYYDNLVIDGYFTEVLSSPILTSKCNEIQLNKDGTWRVQTVIGFDDSIEIFGDDVEIVPNTVAPSSFEEPKEVDQETPIPEEENVVDLTLSDSDDDEPLANTRTVNPMPEIVPNTVASSSSEKPNEVDQETPNPEEEENDVVDLTISDSDDDEPLAITDTVNPKPGMGLSQEVNLRTLSPKHGLTSKSKKQYDRIEKYVKTLEDMIDEVRKMAQFTQTVANNYNKRINAIKVAVGITTNTYENEQDPEVMRSNSLGLRQRNAGASSEPGVDDLDHENMQKKITTEMLCLREQLENAKKIIEKDTEARQNSMYQQNIYSSYGLASNYPIRPDVKFRRLPFYDILADLLKPSTLVPRSNQRMQVGFFNFHLTPQQATDLVNSRLDREYGKQVQMRFCLMETTCEQEDCFPPNVVVKVNHKLCPLPNPKPTNKPRPVNITQMVTLSPMVANTITVSWASDYGRGYAITVALVDRLSWQDLLRRLMNKGVRNAHHTRAMIKEKLNANCDSLMVSLKCPLGKMRMTTPCRAITCSHLQCFDASLFLQVNERNPTWICPVCDKPSLYDNLVIDGYFTEVLSSPILTSKCNEIQLNKDGTWRVQTVIGFDDSIEIFGDDVEIVPNTVALCSSEKRKEVHQETREPEKKKKDVFDLTISDSDDDEPLAITRVINPKPNIVPNPFAPSSCGKPKKKKKDVVDLTISDSDDDEPLAINPKPGMGLSRQEVNLSRLSPKYGLMSKSKKEYDRIEKYVKTLEDMIHEVRKMAEFTDTVANNYNRRINAIKVAVGITTNTYEDEQDPEVMRSNSIGLRQRNARASSKPGVDDLDRENMQKKITTEMLYLREQLETVKKIIQKDTEVGSTSSHLTEQNYAQLTKESSKLAKHSKRAGKCLMWIMLAVVLIAFIYVALFRKVMKKIYCIEYDDTCL